MKMFKKVKKVKLSFRNFKTIMGSLLIIGGMLLGLYVGGYLMFIKGIAGLIDIVVAAINHTKTIEGMAVAINVGKIIFSGFVGYITGVIPVIIGSVLLD